MNTHKKQAYVIRHVAFEDLGSFEAKIRERYDIHYLDAGVDDLQTIVIQQSDLCIILGGPISAYEVSAYPFIQDTIDLLKTRIHYDLPTLGICLGAQLIANALGANVYSGSEKEIGWFPIKLSTAGQGNYFRYLGDNIPIFHWHGDTFDLPSGAILQASTSLYPNQAFTYGRHILALQFHPEIRGAHIEKWLIGHAYEISKTPSVSIHQLRMKTKQYAPHLMQQSQLFLTGWLDVLNGEG